MGPSRPAQVPVSVVIPAYNEATRIGAALESVRAQTVAPLEVLVIDDGSTDDTAAIAQEAGARVIRQPNRGLAATRNRGLREAVAPWIAFLDADDQFFPEKLQRMWAAHERRPEVHFIVCDFAFVDPGRRLVRYAMAATPQYRSMERLPLGDGVAFVTREALAAALCVGNFFNSSTVLIEREFVLEHGLVYDEKLPSDQECHVAEDIEWYLRALRLTDALIVEKPLATYVRRPGSLAASGGRVRAGDVRLGELVAAHPERYAPTAPLGFARARALHLRRAGLDWFRELELSRARSRFAESFAARPSGDTAALFAIAAVSDNRVGRFALTSLRAAWRRRPRRRREFSLEKLAQMR